MRKLFRAVFASALTAAVLVSQAATVWATEPDYSGGPGVYVPPETPAEEETVTENPVEPLPLNVAADVQARIDSTTLSLTLLRPDLTLTDPIYVGPEGSSVSVEQGFMSISIFNGSLPGDVLYRVYSSATGWTRWYMNGERTPWDSGALIEAIQIRLNGVINDYYDISYAATLSDGTVCGLSYNGDTNGTMGTGQYITGLQFYLTRKGVRTANKNNDRVASATSFDGIQFGEGLPTYVSGTGAAFTGWAWNGNDRYYFIDNNAVTGWQYIDGYKYYFDESGRLVTDLEPILGAGGPFLIKINKQMNCTTVYVQDGGNGFIIPLKSFLCSTGDDTPIGTFHTPEKFRWHLMIHGVYCQYLTRLGSGLHILLHSAVYDAPSYNALQTDTYNYMGIARSAGCIRFIARDCKWIYDNCPLGTTIQVYNSAIPGPYERPCVPELISLSQTWDPTDPEAIAVNQAAEAAAAQAAAAAAAAEAAAALETDEVPPDSEFWSA